MTVTLSRRRLIGGAVVLAIASSVPSVGMAQDDDRNSDHPYLPEATFARMMVASNITEETIFTEPMTMIFSAYGFPDESTAERAFPGIVDYFETKAANSVVDAEYERVSVGRLGDDRAGIYAITEEGLRDLFVIVRVGPNVLYVRAFAFGGDTVEYVAEYLSDFLPGVTEDPESLLPAIDDLPIGWERDEFASGGDVLEVVTSKTPGATPAA